MRLPKSILSLAGVFMACLAWGQAVPSSEPSSTHIFPAGGRRGTVVKVRVGGECLPPGMNFKIVGAGVTGPSVLGPEVKARYEPSLRRLPRDGDAVGAAMSYPREFDASLTISPDAGLGTSLWRVWGAWGGTRPRPFLVGDLPEFIETEPNSQPELAERITLPVVVNGQIAGERDQDFFVFHAQADAVVVCDVMAARIGSPLEPVLTITDAHGNRLEVQETRVGNDPVISFLVPKSGDYRMHVANLSFYGGPAYVYRITVSTRPYVAFVFPPAGRTGTTRTVEVFTPTGTSSYHVAKQKMTFPRQAGPFRTADGLALVAGALPEIVGTADNHAFQSAMELMVPVAVSGRFLKADEDDWFRITAKKDEVFTIACAPWPPASAASPVLAIHDPSGAALVTASSAEAPDEELVIDWKAPTDGVYRLRVRDLQHGSKGGPEFIYRLTARRARPDFSLRLGVDYVNLVQGGKAEIDLLVQRTGGFTGPIDLTAEGLPDRVSLTSAHIADNQTRVKLALAANGDARPLDALVRLIGTATLAGEKIVRSATVSSFGIERTALHVTVQHKPVFRLSCKEAYQYTPRGSIHPYLMKIERLDNFNGPIVLQLCDRQVQDLDGVEILETAIPPGATEAMNLIYFPETMHASVQAHSRPYAQAYASFTDKWGQKQVLLAVSTHRCMVRTLPPVVKLRALTKEIVAPPGAIADCVLALERTSFDGAADIELMPCPGVTAAKVHMQPDQKDAVVRVQLSRDARDLDGRVLRFRCTGRLADGGTALTEATVPVKIEADKPLTIELWPGKAPDETAAIGPEKSVMSPKLSRKEVEVTESTRMVTNVTKPSITIYRPAKEKDTGTAVIICPGGGYWNLYWQLEGEEVAAWLNSLGVTGIILKYRVPRRPGEPEREPARRPLQDAQRAVSLVRSHAKDWGIGKDRIGIVGFSAGGHLAIATATSFEKRTYAPVDDIDTIDCRPNFAIAVYSGYLKAKDKDEIAAGLRIPRATPPIFLVHGGADIISPPEHSVVMYRALRHAGIPAELHIYAGATHDFGVRPSDQPCSTWTHSCAQWLRQQGFLPK